MRIHVIGATVLLLTLDACSSGQNLPYYLSISPQLESQALPASQGRNDDVSCERIELSSADSVCTVNIHRIVQSVVEMNRSAPMTPKDFQNEFEGRFDSALQEIKKTKKIFVASPPEDAGKWIAIYSLEASDPDDELERLEENLRSMRLVKKIDFNSERLKPDKSTEGPEIPSSYWCGRATEEKAAGVISCPEKETNTLYKLFSCAFNTKTHRCTQIDGTDFLEKSLLAATKEVRREVTRDVRFVVLGYDIPWDQDHTRIRYGITLYFKHRDNPVDPATQDYLKKLSDEQKQDAANPTGNPIRSKAAEAMPVAPFGFVGYTLVYTNEATPAPFLPVGQSYGSTVAVGDWWEPYWYFTA